MAVTIAGFPEYSITEFRRAGPTSLVHWPADDLGGSENYGAASLFMHYLTEHYSEHYEGRGDLRALLAEPGDGKEGINAYLDAAGYDARFEDVFRDWAVANLLDEDDSPYGYAEQDINFPVYRNLESGEELSSTIPQYANEYIRLELPPVGAVLSFEGDAAVPLLPVDVGEGCWWSNKGDVIDSTLTTSLDLSDSAGATLDYQVWFSIEEDWDYAYLEVSEDGGRTWAVLETPLTSNADPLGVSFGPGYTGKSGGWRDESISLDEWAGQEIMVRFQYITDAAVHGHGLCLRHLAASDGASPLPLSWTPNGFVWTNNLVRQSHIVQVIYEGMGDSPSRVLQVPLKAGNQGEITGEITLAPDANARRIVAVVQAVAPATRMPARYALRLDPAG